MGCEHDRFKATVSVSRIAASDSDPSICGFMADVSIECACGEPFIFRGAPRGLSWLEPRTSIDSTVLSAPVAPRSNPGFGAGNVGFDVNVLAARREIEGN